MASQGGDDGGRWGGSPATERVGSAYLDEDDPVTIRNAPADRPGRSTDKNWAPGGDGPATLPRDHGAPVAIFDGPTSGDDDANVTQRRFAIRERHGTMPMDQVLVPSHEMPPGTAPPAATPHPPTPRVMPPPTPQVSTPSAPVVNEQVLPNPLQPSRLQSPSATTLASETDPPPPANWTPPPAFSDRPPWEQEQPEPKRGFSVALAIVTLLVLVGGAFALGWLLRPSNETQTATETSASPSDEPPRADDDEPASEASADPYDTSPEASAAPDGTSPEASSAPDDASPKSPDEPTKAELAKLLSYEGFLTVTSTADAEVYVQGKHVGATNERLVSKCYQRFVRLKKGTDGEWITPGRPVRIACMSSTTVEINPE